MIQKIIRAGLQYDLPTYIERRVIPTNMITLLLMLGVALPFLLITFYYAPIPILLAFPGAGILTCIGVLIANQFGGIMTSRFFLAGLPIYEISLYNAYLCQPGEPALVGPSMIGLGFILVPFLVIDIKEKAFITATVIFCAIPVIFWPFFRDMLNLDPEQIVAVSDYVQSYKTGWLRYLMVTVGLLIAFGNMLGLVSISKNAERESELARKESEKNNQELQSKQSLLQENLLKIEQSQEEDRKRSWATQGFSQLANILRSGKVGDDIFDTTLSMIVNYVKANQGALFIVEKDEQSREAKLQMASCYAFKRKKFIEKTFAPGQGSVGQAFLEGEYIYMTNVPRDYVHITSGLGDAPPTAVLVMPLKVNEQIEGILELAFFHKIEPHEIEFIEKLGENLASFIQSNRINTNTKELLEAAQIQAEELRAQEEEMQQNMEELAATQEEMQRKEKEYLKIIEYLKQGKQVEF